MELFVLLVAAIFPVFAALTFFALKPAPSAKPAAAPRARPVHIHPPHKPPTADQRPEWVKRAQRSSLVPKDYTSSRS